MANAMGIDFAADVAEAAADMGTVLTLDAQTITGVLSIIRTPRRVEEDGVWTESDAQFLCVVADWTDSTLPALQKTVSVRDVNYYVEEITQNEDGTTAVLSLRRKA